MRRVLALVAGLSVFLAVFLADLFGVSMVGKFTDSGFLGICGPCGSDAALWIMTSLLIVGFVGSGWVAYRTGRAVSRRNP